MAAVLLAMGAMALKDALGTWLVQAEAHGHSWLAGALDAGGDLANILVVIAGAGVVIQHGWTLHSALVLGCMMVVSLFGTALWTWLGFRRIKDERVTRPFRGCGDEHIGTTTDGGW